MRVIKLVYREEVEQKHGSTDTRARENTTFVAKYPQC